MTIQNTGRAENLNPWKPGQSGNPGGRPKGLARQVRELVGNDGKRLAEFHLAVATLDVELLAAANVTAKQVTVRDRQTSVAWLAERGWGKPATFAPVEEGDPLELSNVAVAIDKVVDELAGKRATRTPRPSKNGSVANERSNGATPTV
ncbi:MAG: DUF5681 domain-containing protein [Gemmatimonadaceae bacterium]|nr:DUF5681 domain-containing protein [Gemmatimonadaceae bacterium]